MVQNENKSPEIVSQNQTRAGKREIFEIRENRGYTATKLHQKCHLSRLINNQNGIHVPNTNGSFVNTYKYIHTT